MQISIKTKYTPQGDYQLVSPGRYHDGSPALEVHGGDGVQFKATVCVPDHIPAPHNVMIKDWSENEGVLDALVGAGVIEPPIKEVPINYVTAYECRLTDAAWTVV